MRHIYCVRHPSMAVQQYDCGLQYYVTTRHIFCIQENIQKFSPNIDRFSKCFKRFLWVFWIVKDGVSFIKSLSAAQESIAVRAFDSKLVTSSNKNEHFCVCISRTNGLIVYALPASIFLFFLVILTITISKTQKIAW